jgi:hypothetical protein
MRIFLLLRESSFSGVCHSSLMPIMSAIVAVGI